MSHIAPDQTPLAYFCDRQRHLVCRPYSIENLHRMAAELGLKRCWYHAGAKPHYDIPVRRKAEIEALATIVEPRAILAIIREGIAKA